MNTSWEIIIVVAAIVIVYYFLLGRHAIKYVYRPDLRNAKDTKSLQKRLKIGLVVAVLMVAIIAIWPINQITRTFTIQSATQENTRDGHELAIQTSEGVPFMIYIASNTDSVNKLLLALNKNKELSKNVSIVYGSKLGLFLNIETITLSDGQKFSFQD